MLTSRIIPCLDVADGRVVKGVRFQGLRDAGDPAERALAYQDQGADEIVILDVAATPEGRGNQIETVERVRAQLSIPLTVGGGIRALEDAQELLEAGADKVSVNTAAVADPSLLTRIAQHFGSQCTVLAIDAAMRNDKFVVLIRGGRQAVELDAIEWAREAQELGAGEILLTSWDRDGTRSGYDLALLDAVTKAVHIPVIASGGADSAAHIKEAFDHGADAVLAASIFHDNDTTVEAVKLELLERGVNVRP